MLAQWRVKGALIYQCESSRETRIGGGIGFLRRLLAFAGEQIYSRGNRTPLTRFLMCARPFDVCSGSYVNFRPLLTVSLSTFRSSNLARSESCASKVYSTLSF
jgi:hypothetical protein